MVSGQSGSESGAEMRPRARHVAADHYAVCAERLSNGRDNSGEVFTELPEGLLGIFVPLVRPLCDRVGPAVLAPQGLIEPGDGGARCEGFCCCLTDRTGAARFPRLGERRDRW